VASAARCNASARERRDGESARQHTENPFVGHGAFDSIQQAGDNVAVNPGSSHDAQQLHVDSLSLGGFQKAR